MLRYLRVRILFQKKIYVVYEVLEIKKNSDQLTWLRVMRSVITQKGFKNETYIELSIKDFKRKLNHNILTPEQNNKLINQYINGEEI